MQLTEWMAYATVEPFGDEERQAEFRAALVASTIVNVNRDPKKKPIEVDKFMRENYLEKEQSPDQQELVEKVFSTFGVKPPTPIHPTPDPSPFAGENTGQIERGEER